VFSGPLFFLGAYLDDALEHLVKFAGVFLGVPDCCPRNGLTALRGLEDEVAITIPSSRTACSIVEAVEMLLEKETRLELAEVVVVDVCDTRKRSERHACWFVSRSKERRRMHDLLSRDRHVLVGNAVFTL
jgi:hypothetical protein